MSSGDADCSSHTRVDRPANVQQRGATANRERGGAVIVRMAHALVPARFRPFGYLERIVQQRTGNTVISRPFTGLRYLQSAIGSAYAPKLLGIYERELHGCIERACGSNPQVVVDVGAAEGYYAVGLARRLLRAKVVAFEAEARGRGLLAKMCQLNGIGDHFQIKGRCGLGDLQAVLDGASTSFVVCDVEGYEDILLNPDLVPALRLALILVETHDALVAGVTARLRERFTATHEVAEIPTEIRTPEDFPYRTWISRRLPRRYLDWIVSERPPGSTSWLWMTPRMAT